MNLNNATFTISAVLPNQYPESNLFEVAFAGRSNVGKSSLINKLLNRKSLARVSQKPGRTATINFYNIDEKLFFVDLPGYGYAQVSKEEKRKWAQMIETYLNTRKQLKQIILLVDSRHRPTDNDIDMMKYVRVFCKRAVVVATKFDKLKKTEVDEKLKTIITTLKLSGEDVIIPFSTVKNIGIEEFWSYIEEEINIYEGAYK